jgi:hypothetical protein
MPELVLDCISESWKVADMKTKICAGVLAISGFAMVIFAAKVDPCTEKFNSCSDACTNALARCKAGGSIPENCEKTHATCMKACEKAKADCEGPATSSPAKPKK